jgi:exosortase family protein XrtF
MVLSGYINKWNNVPKSVKAFIFKALAILLVWKIVYLAFLLPTRLIDKPLTYSVGSATAWLLNTCTHSTNYTTKSVVANVSTDAGLTPMPLQKVYFRGTDIVSIEDTCNALELFVLYAGFIICMPAKTLRKVLFIAGGIIAIYIVNVLRCAGVTYVIIYDPKYADFAHHYVFTFIVYGFIIALWLIFSKKLNLTHAENQ